MADKYYYADGRKIPLEVSDRFMAVRADEGARGRLGAMAARASSTMAPVQVHDVPEYGLSVLILPNGGTPAAARGAAREALSAMVGAEPSLSEGPEVLEPEGAGGMAVIPVGEVIVKFKPGASAEARRKLLDKHKLEMKRQDYPEPGADLMITEGDAIAAANALQEVRRRRPRPAELRPYRCETRPRHRLRLRGGGGEPGRTGDRPAADGRSGIRLAVEPAEDQAPEAWDITTGSPRISVAIIDEGCDIVPRGHQLQGRLRRLRGDNDPTPNGNDAHGTACAGVAAMRMDNGSAASGVAPGCRVVPHPHRPAASAAASGHHRRPRWPTASARRSTLRAVPTCCRIRMGRRELSRQNAFATRRPMAGAARAARLRPPPATTTRRR